eukprot:7837519-Ditylum_brightwellii.AAC.1
MKLYWEKQELCLAVYNKENQCIKYMNKESCHCASVIKAIPEGVFACLCGLTSRTKENKKVHITELYPDHREALRVAKILQKKQDTNCEGTLQYGGKTVYANRNGK